jgi:hypothetical protein
LQWKHWHLHPELGVKIKHFMTRKKQNQSGEKHTVGTVTMMAKVFCVETQVNQHTASIAMITVIAEVPGVKTQVNRHTAFFALVIVLHNITPLLRNDMTILEITSTAKLSIILTNRDYVILAQRSVAHSEW